MDYEQLKYKTITEIGDFVEKGDLCPEDIIHFYLEKISSDPEAKHVFTEVLEKSSISSAKESKQRAKAGLRKSILDGIPLSVKDLANIKGYHTGGGSLMTNNSKAEENALFINDLQDHGVIFMGKTHMTELAFSGLGLNPITATPKNPFNRELVAGGSSSGSAVSVSKNFCLASIGSDTGGSVRIPAAWNNLVGLKTTHNIVDLTGVLKLCPSFDTIGPICRSVEDAHLIFSAITNAKFKKLKKYEQKNLKFLVIKNIFFDDIDSDIYQSFNETIETLVRNGATVEYRDFEEIDDVLEISKTVFPAEAYGMWGDKIEKNPEKMYGPILKRFRSGKNILAHDYLSSLFRLFDLRTVFLKKTMGFDAILAPTSSIKPPSIEKLLNDDNFFTEQNLLALRNTRMANSLNLCALTLPNKISFSGLMIMAHPYNETHLLNVGLTLEKSL
jgi:aspartyl-tRNA(Asn)/glutamyl-tRNA(Gln) amidotransferase subunit A